MSLSFARASVGLLVLLAGFWIATSSTARADTPPNYNGSYELAGNRTDRIFSLEVHQTGSRAKVDFSAAMADGSGAAPEAEGTGKIDDGILSFKFKDSFNNEGTCTLQPGKKGYQLDMVVTKMVDPAPLHFYAALLLKKTSNRTTSQ